MAEKLLADLVVKLGMDDEGFKGGINDSITSITGLSSSTLAAGGLIGGVLATIGVAAVGLGNEFDEAFDTIRLGTGATGKDLESLKGSFANVFDERP